MKRNPYSNGKSFPRVSSVDGLVDRMTCGDGDAINFYLWEARQDNKTLVALFERLAAINAPNAAARIAFHKV